MRTLISSCVTSVVAGMLAGTALGGKPVDQTSEGRAKVEERAVFVTGSLIPQRIRLQPIGTPTFSPVRIIARREIDQTGRFTAGGILIDEPSLRLTGH